MVYAMKKQPSKPNRANDSNMRMASIMQEVIALTNKPIKAPTRSRKTKRRI
jgi:uncharacterized protein YciW